MMTLVTPSNLKYILNISITSRLIVLAIQFAANIIIEDHDADAYRNRYHLSLIQPGNDTATSTLPDFFIHSYKFVQGLTKWDAQYFLEIAQDGYISEQHLAFLPGFPIIIAVTRKFLFNSRFGNHDYIFRSTSSSDLGLPSAREVTSQDLEAYIHNSIIGVVLNNFILFPIACVFLYMLTRLVKSNDETYARNVIWWFCFNPASVFFSACYSESTYAALTFMVLFIMEYRVTNYLTSHQSETYEFIPLKQLNRLLFTVLPALAPLAIATGTRSNALVHMGFIAYQFLMKYLSLLTTNRRYWIFMSYMCTALEIVQDVLVLLMSCVFAASGYITFQLYSYILFCKQHGRLSHEKGSMIAHKPEWCDKQFPHPYGHVQAKYWNVGLFSYYEVKQLPNFLLALPVTYIIMTSSLKETRVLAKSLRGKKQLAYYMQAVMLTLLCSVSINIQVVTRIIASSCPAFYWICADATQRLKKKDDDEGLVDKPRSYLWFWRSGVNGKKEFAARKRKSLGYRSVLLQIYFLVYFVVGIVLHVNFYPWT